MIDTSRSALNVDLPGCAAGDDTAPLLMKTFLQNVVRDFAKNSLFTLPDLASIAGNSGNVTRGGQVRVGAITYNQRAEVSFGFLDNEQDILGNLTTNIDFLGRSVEAPSHSTCGMDMIKHLRIHLCTWYSFATQATRTNTRGC